MVLKTDVLGTSRSGLTSPKDLVLTTTKHQSLGFDSDLTPRSWTRYRRSSLHHESLASLDQCSRIHKASKPTKCTSSRCYLPQMCSTIPNERTPNKILTSLTFHVTDKSRERGNALYPIQQGSWRGGRFEDDVRQTLPQGHQETRIELTQYYVDLNEKLGPGASNCKHFWILLLYRCKNTDSSKKQYPPANGLLKPLKPVIDPAPGDLLPRGQSPTIMVPISPSSHDLKKFLMN